MDTFRLILIFVGIAILVLIYAFEMRRRERRKPQKEPFVHARDAVEDGSSLDLNDLETLRAERTTPELHPRPTPTADLGPGEDEVVRTRIAKSASVPVSPALAESPVRVPPNDADAAPEAETTAPSPVPIAETTDSIGAEPARSEDRNGGTEPPLPPAPSEAGAAPPATGRPSVPERPTPGSEPTAPVALPEVPPGMAEMIVALHVMAADGESFAGGDLRTALEDAGLVFGAMDIFHHPRGGHALFSVANLVEPGIFAPDGMADSTTRGVVLFLRLPGPESGREAYDTMLRTAEQMAETLHGRVRDERRNPLTKQNIGLTRERIAEYEYKLEVARKRAAR